MDNSKLFLNGIRPQNGLLFSEACSICYQIFTLKDSIIVSGIFPIPIPSEASYANFFLLFLLCSVVVDLIGELRTSPSLRTYSLRSHCFYSWKLFTLQPLAGRMLLNDLKGNKLVPRGELRAKIGLN